ncbi:MULTISPECIES: LysR substrate-binding domain-containing protein [unclassified Pseudomonas]|uniref:LysR substrate-binding domain-containing protein n=1 Tax=unclassified Pseudomonas TaxID=196821 RepID=UPI000837F1A3|nr:MULTISPECIES: LysR substrate-binding domain-containing protein [unclassified Pseudomonas]QIH08131.1 LysR family transcriptional regulator [Pseudomonas sp. BIOMIG1BAC]
MAFPPLNSIKVFESVARLGNLAAAAVELHVTAGAVSQQLKTLQGALAVELFEKRGRQLVLTDAGRVFHQRIAHALTDIGDAVAVLQAPAQAMPGVIELTLSLPPLEGIAWLTPALFHFMEQNLGVKLKVISASYFNQVDWRKADIAVVYGTPPWSGFWWRLLHGIRLVPVCSAQYLRGPRAIRSVADLARHRLLHEDNGAQWGQWLAEAGATLGGLSDVYFEDFGLVLQAAREGFGVALSDELVSVRDLEEGRLVAPLAISSAAVHNYYCVCAESQRARPEVMGLIEWLASTVQSRASSSDWAQDQ